MTKLAFIAQYVRSTFGFAKKGPFAGEAFIAGGTESMSRVPMMGFNVLPHPSWDEKALDDYVKLGLTAERVARKYNITREERDSFAFESHRKARAAQTEERLASEIAPYCVGSQLLADDGCNRDTTPEQLSDLKTPFLEGGTVTAASSSHLTDGGTAVLVCTEEFAVRHGIEPPARVRSFAVYGCAADIMGIGSVEASRKALLRAGLASDEIDIIEMNGAFAAQSEACRRELNSEGEAQYRRWCDSARSSAWRHRRPASR